VFEDEGIEEGFDDFLFVGVELANGFELEAELIARTPRGLVEEEIIGRDAERNGEALDGFQRGLAGAGLVAVDLDGMDARELAQGLLGQPARFAEGGDTLRKRHGAERGEARRLGGLRVTSAVGRPGAANLGVVRLGEPLARTIIPIPHRLSR